MQHPAQHNSHSEKRPTITTAIAIDTVWERETWIFSGVSSLNVAAVAPSRRICGLPDTSLYISISLKEVPFFQPVPMALKLFRGEKKPFPGTPAPCRGRQRSGLLLQYLSRYLPSYHSGFFFISLICFLIYSSSFTVAISLVSARS